MELHVPTFCRHPYHGSSMTSDCSTTSFIQSTSKRNAERLVPQVPHHPCWWHVNMIQFYTIKLNSADVTDYFASCVSMFLYFPSTPTLLVLNQAAHYMCNSDLWTPQRHSCSHNTHTLHTLLHWPYSDTCTGVLSIVNNSYLQLWVCSKHLVQTISLVMIKYGYS